jgi:hypothetical protein
MPWADEAAVFVAKPASLAQVELQALTLDETQ